MTGAMWWERAATGDGARQGADGAPELVEATRERVRAEIGARIPGYTPDWSNPDRADAGVALVRLFGVQAEPLLRRLNRLPEKLQIEQLITAGVRSLPASVATADLRFTVTPPDGQSVLIPAGFQAAAAPASGQGERVLFETGRELHATPAAITTVLVEERGRRQPVTGVATETNRPFPAFGARPRPGNALWIGFSGRAAPYPAVSLAFAVNARPGAPDAQASGGDSREPADGPLLRWQVLDGTRFVTAEVAHDGTAGLRTSGVVELRVPRSWRPGRPPGPAPLPELRWLRVTVAHGAFPEPPVITRLLTNVVEAAAVRTVRSEALQPITTGPVDGRTRMRLNQTPVVPGSVVLAVDGDSAGDVFGTVASPATRWREVPSLAGAGPDDRVFTVEHETGEVTFGDGVRGAKVPLGFRNVVAELYRVGGGAAGAVPAGAVRSLVTSLAHVTGVTNPSAASGGADPETTEETVRRGAAQLGAGGRAVAPADYALLALRAPGALVARAHAVPGLDLQHPGRPVPGVVGVFVVPGGPAADDPPVPDAAALRAVATHLSREVAPVGVRVTTGAARFQRAGVEARLVLDPALSRAEALVAAGDALTGYLDPLRGGDDGGGWPFGGPIRHAALVRRLLAVPGVRAVPRLRVVLDGVAASPCTDVALRPHALPWPSRPVLVPVAEPTAGAA
ncbi:putative phage baseplate assembly protein [Catenuloplanes nepalensis]|uniref:Phage baseplate assembly protein n=1 Tax=Catenuloplanes nepalensis TaxID=587533 RepID=A0ABT9MPE5_9ACTN|nr:putative baseplate assembly protein [Catenuloplanes nepalensis]MDP9793186.1 putative phage baseplate assembly protein [Catenuloplanes nepalensis]